MDLNIKYTKKFKNNFKKLSKKYKSINKDLIAFIIELNKNPDIGEPLGNGFHKIRIRNSDNNKGKSGGYRTITYYDNGDSLILMTIYSKSEQESISEKELLEILNTI